MRGIGLHAGGFLHGLDRRDSRHAARRSRRFDGRHGQRPGGADLGNSERPFHRELRGATSDRGRHLRRLDGDSGQQRFDDHPPGVGSDERHDLRLPDSRAERGGAGGESQSVRDPAGGRYRADVRQCDRGRPSMDSERHHDTDAAEGGGRRWGADLPPDPVDTAGRDDFHRVHPHALRDADDECRQGRVHVDGDRCGWRRRGAGVRNHRSASILRAFRRLRVRGYSQRYRHVQRRSPGKPSAQSSISGTE